MYGQTTQIDDVVSADGVAADLVAQFITLENNRRSWLVEKAEIQKYLFATDTTKTANSSLPWKNKTTYPKLCQIRDNLIANYLASLFPKRNWLDYEADDKDSNQRDKKDLIKAYMYNLINHPLWKIELIKSVCDYVDYGNSIATVQWIDDTIETPEGKKIGFVGPVPLRISPIDIVFNVAAPSFQKTGKFIRTLWTLGDLAAELDKETSLEKKDRVKEILAYCVNLRTTATTLSGTSINSVKDAIFETSGFLNFVSYLKSGQIEVITFYGDYYDVRTNTLHKNKKITIVDRHKLLFTEDNPFLSATDGMVHVGWRIRQDHLMAMGPLDNLVGMQYRIDHLENLNADIFDLIAAPPLKVKGNVEDFKWGPFERIYVGDEGDIEVLAPDVNALSANLEISSLEQKMEEMAGSPKESLGFRTPGEKTAFEVQRLENAAARVFSVKIKQFEEYFLEPLLNLCLELAQKNLPSFELRSVDPLSGVTKFTRITNDDLQGNGKIKPLAARHFAEKAEMVQNVSQFFSSSVGADEDVKLHFSSIKLAKMYEDLLDMEKYQLVEENIRVTERQDAQQLHNAASEDTQMAAATPAGISADDHTLEPAGAI
jgi:hypothetical protein